MISYLVLKILLAIVFVLTYPLRLLSDVSLDGSFSVALSQAGMYLGVINQWSSLTYLMSLFAVFLAIETFVFLYKIIMWLIKKIPTIS